MTWATVPLGELIELRYGKALKAEDRSGSGFPVIGSGGVAGAHRVPLVKEPTIVVGRKGSIGSLTYAAEGCWPIDTAYYVRARRTLDVRWLYWTMHGLGLGQMNKSAAVPGLNRDDAYRARIPLPPLPEQRRIAAILDEADAIRASRARSISLLERQSTDLFDALFNGSMQSIEHDLLGNRLEFLTSGSRGWARYYSESGAKFLRIQNVRAGRVQLDDVAYVSPPETAEARRTRVMEGDVVLSITADLGRTAVIPANFGDAHINQHLAILRTPRINPVFLAGYLESRTGSQQLLGMDRGQTKAGLNFDNIRSLRVPLPELTLQNDYAEGKAAIEQEMARHQMHLQSLDALFASLQHRAFRGEI